MTAVKERIIGAVSIMSDKDANIFWHIIQKHFKLPDTFADIEKVEPDETDLIMLKEIENNPDCHEFISQEECDSGVVGNARPCQGRDRGFEPRLSLLKHQLRLMLFSSPSINFP